MSKAKQALGPFLVADYTMMNTEDRPIIVLPKGYAVASVHLLSSEARRDAIAQVMAAGPTLLAACKAAQWALSGKEYDPKRFHDAAKLVADAIALAEPTT